MYLWLVLGGSILIVWAYLEPLCFQEKKNLITKIFPHNLIFKVTSHIPLCHCGYSVVSAEQDTKIKLLYLSVIMST